MKKYVLLDRDGTIIIDKHYLCDPAGVELLPGVVDGLKKFQKSGYGLIILTNQSGIGRGYYQEKDMHAVNNRMTELLAEHGISIAKIYFCPHAPEQNCNCRKPETGMVEAAIRDFGFNIKDSLIIGDKICDIECGIKSGAASILVRTGKGAKEESKCTGKADYIADTISEAADFFICSSKSAM
ncbi:D-glycero-beta-D-manno-heptose 1,7-bisphosphate 7-phosphatase [Maridesulfovibrio bastinii]|uniref:D-glycero-beta-D-manno-heptose 1,7-bisphosphate 7-phosphatase n=1 Tax=Maridesulfovibrio bastinii TaxID=47157 RepID=UPI000484D5E6|nr:D-glycero-beta-D-manno-heptose 1,7-bisphosphate 7-phosphatase [Maridesulfovibrio bastinii]